MKKEDADKIISEYIELIYGFAVSKEQDINKAEWIATCIVYSVVYNLRFKILCRSIKLKNIFKKSFFTEPFSENVDYIYRRYKILR